MFHTLSSCSNIFLLIFTTLRERFYYNFIDKETEAQRSGLSKVTSSSSDNWGLNSDASLSSTSYAHETVSCGLRGKNLDSLPGLADDSLCVFRSVFRFLCALVSISSSLQTTFPLSGQYRICWKLSMGFLFGLYVWCEIGRNVFKIFWLLSKWQQWLTSEGAH